MCIRQNKKGFTLAELLIVVAIIGVLVAISIPIFSGQLEKAREATDAANIRSQYAQVLADALFDGGSVNGKTAYGAVPLRQKTDGWQTAGIDTNLHDVFSEVNGSPVAGGSAWVEYDGAHDKAILHYEDSAGNTTGSGEGAGTGGGSTTGGTGTGTGAGPAGGSTGGGAGAAGSSTAGGAGGSSSSSTGGSTSGSGDGSGSSSTVGAGSTGGSPAGGTGSGESTGGGVADSSTITQALIQSSKIYDSETPKKVEIGEIYSYNGKIYISLTSNTLVAGGTPEPGSWYQYNFVTPTSTVYTSKDANESNVIRQKINYGDLYSADDGSLYICKGGSDYGLLIPTSSSGDWVKILL